jgi:hypothetical protein
MIRSYYRWRYYRREKRPSFTFHLKEKDSFGPAFGHYLSQKGSHQEANTPYEKKKRLKKAGKILLWLCLAGLGIWLLLEVSFAIQFF